jgi:hypothetical protein
LDHDFSVIRVPFGARVVGKPKDFQVAQISKVFDLVKVRDLVFTEVELDQFATIGKFSERGDVVERKGSDLQIGHLSKDRHILERVSKEIQVPDLVQLVGFALLGD